MKTNNDSRINSSMYSKTTRKSRTSTVTYSKQIVIRLADLKILQTKREI